MQAASLAPAGADDAGDEQLALGVLGEDGMLGTDFLRLKASRSFLMISSAVCLLRFMVV